ncbi:helix-turn-helix protein [Corynebacterium lowii]|uniref:Helix-turn-helix protein n=2 Tax=Corynebacterium lowii TaxID=1544413 RepID=A0A0Q0U7S1_9CORY|nr:helix-turn-helix transcriptional regulator [Corynebacterium lowii]KQB83475.1 helix-turn-helix protein [Corynebacterium lowii]MDP9852521.1 transcriptional regulator with XRE-family HTH domain [Corynebacterium lowii]
MNTIQQHTSEFLHTRRSRITPAQAGVSTDNTVRRVAGLRREEVARLANISVDYYIRIERGNLSGVSPDILDALSRALQLNEVEREYLFLLSRAATMPRSLAESAAGTGSVEGRSAEGNPAENNLAGRSPAQDTPESPVLRPTITRILHSMETPAVICDAKLAIVAANSLGKALLSPILQSPQGQRSIVYFIYLDPHARDFFPNYEEITIHSAASLRMEAARRPYDAQLPALIDDLLHSSELFRQRWTMREVWVHRHGDKALRHPLVGELDLRYEVLLLPGPEGFSLNAYTAAPGSTSAARLEELAATL